ncbi:MAG: LapA family protein [Psychromonas sp.]|nr:LapA family protein [Psychromonas sp.]
MKNFLMLVAVIFVFVIAVVLGLKNQEIVNINFILAQKDLRLSTLLAITLSIGICISALFGIYFILKAKFRYRILLKKIKKQGEELDKLRTNLSIKAL